MRGNMHLSAVLILTVILILSPNSWGKDSWYTRFDTTGARIESADSILSLDDALRLVAIENPAFRSFGHQLEAARGKLKQAGLWSNPELTAELEGVCWDTPGFRESELAVSLSQEFEFFGQRGARKNVAVAGIDAVNLQVELAAFDLYLETKQRFYTLAHAQQNVILSQASVDLVREITLNITHRLDKGTALQSELLLAQLEEQRVELALDQSKQEVMAVEATLVSLWNGNPSGLTVSAETEPDFTRLLNQVSSISDSVDSSRDIMQLHSDAAILHAEKKLAIAEAKPTMALSGGFKRSQADKSKSFLFGVSLPIPLFNRNQGVRQSIDATLLSLEYAIERSANETRANIQSQAIRLRQLIDTHAALDLLLLPTAENAYQKLQNAYEAGRVPYTQLLESERFLNNLSFEHNDILLDIQEQIIALERLTGVTMRVDTEN